eukprot:6400834-Pyramimonas_sp.AAC.1
MSGRRTFVLELHGVRAIPVQTVAVAFAPRTFVLKVRSIFTTYHGSGVVFWHDSGSRRPSNQVNSWR